MTVSTYGDFGMPAEAPGADKVVFGQVLADNGFTVMAYDIPGQSGGSAATGSTRREHGVTITDQPFFVSVNGSSLDEVLASACSPIGSVSPGCSG
ncbi:hypothetical protein JL106_11580 [Nakamurella sp. YIM 132084]|uniref:Alpha/beta hydrolase n=1 Tax=Nakamurella leprariae TaxID=2803911 RepID=A0A939C2A6_9ACTN|nr:hypothetical protein [Nakamurella leprariae]MBM9467922.1 hypothetical protein [Nakamurella leprariae]